MEIQHAIPVDIVNPNHRSTVVVRLRVPQPSEHHLQPLGRDATRPFLVLEHLERPPQILLLASAARATVHSHQPHKIIEVYEPVPVGVVVVDHSPGFAEG